MVTNVSVYSQTAQLSDEILKVKRETELELFGEEQTWARGETVVSNAVCFLLEHYFSIFSSSSIMSSNTDLLS